jgi:hypothetical protein
MLEKRLAGHFVGVLRRDGKHDAAAAQIESKALDGKVRFSARIALGNGDAFKAVVALTVLSRSRRWNFLLLPRWAATTRATWSA